jgi:hypothetical protein
LSVDFGWIDRQFLSIGPTRLMTKIVDRGGLNLHEGAFGFGSTCEDFGWPWDLIQTWPGQGIEMDRHWDRRLS